MAENRLTVNESVMLLALDDDNGRIRWSASPYLDYALAGGTLAELILRNLITLDEEKRVLPNPEKSGETTESALLNDILKLVREAPEPHSPATWVSTLLTLQDIAQRQMEELVKSGILEAHKETFLFFFPTTTYPMRNRTPEKELIQQIRDVILKGGDVPPHLAALITLANGSHLLRGPLTDDELDTHQDRLTEIASTRVIASATRDLIRESERALYVASSIPFMGVPQL